MAGKMGTSEIAQPYASALMSLAKSNNLTEEFGQNVRSLLALVKESEELRNFFANPFVEMEDKKAVLGKVVGDDTNAYFRNFLMLLVDRRRIMWIEDICQQYLALLRQMNQISLAEVISAIPLSEEQQQSIKDKVKAMTSAREVELETSIDKDIIGGVIIKVGSQVIDGSLKGQLRRLSLRLNSV
ncbi:MAG: ATP synthase F1 subunit delta [Cyanobacteria bacterium P01_A01_bin.80]